MPIYNFKCKDCGEKFELLTFSINEKVYCIKCKSDKLDKIPSKFGFGGSVKESSSSSSSCSSCSSLSCSTCKSK